MTRARIPAPGAAAARVGVLRRAATVFLMCFIGASGASGAWTFAKAEEVEPPPEATGEDYTLERADTLSEGSVETSFTADGREGGRPRRGQRLRFRSSGASATVREGADPLAGGALDADVRGGRLRVGRLSPRWGQGLVIGGAAEPWSRAASDRGEGAAYRGRSGDGAAFDPVERAGVGVLAGRFQRRRLAGARAQAGPCAFGMLGAGRARQGSLAMSAADAGGVELAADARGRWRAEAAARRWIRDGALLTWRLRGGHAAFRSLAEPRRSGPARALALTLERQLETSGAFVHGALWSFGPGASGARGALEVHQRLVHHADVVFGIEEQRGTRKDPALFAVTRASSGLRQGWWCEWRGRRDDRELALRHELWGERAFARHALRRVLVARGGTTLPLGGSLTLQHSVWSARTGEKLWLPEAADDRLTLRSVSGSGSRTRLELDVPALSGRARAGVTWTEGAGRRAPPGWTLEWTRRTRL